jgi:hypothetical protein
MLTRRSHSVLLVMSFWIESVLFVLGACTPAADPNHPSGTGGSAVFLQIFALLTRLWQG